VTPTIASSTVASLDHDPSGQRVSWRRLTRVAFIQHRAALVTIFVAFVVFVIAIVVGRDAVGASYAKYVAAGCTLAHPNNLQVCADTSNQFTDIPSFTPLIVALRLFPLVIGAFVGAPLIAREMESGTYRFAWTQGVGRVRLLIVTLAMLALIVTPVADAIGFLLGGWYIHPYAVINIAVGSQWQSGLFTTTWWMTPVWTLFALALGTLASSRMLLFGMNSGPLNSVATRGQGPAGSWLVRAWFTGPDGHVLGIKAAKRVSIHVERLLESAGGNNNPVAARHWLAAHHYTYWVSYQPADHFWILQAVVGLVILALTPLCVVASARCIQGRRTKIQLEAPRSSH
jgi:hypothetical protein